MDEPVMWTVLAVVVVYLLGAIPFALIVARLLGIKDIRKTGSGNPGATNVWRAAGPVAAFLVFAGDVVKGVLSIMIASVFLAYLDVSLLTPDVFLVVIGTAAVIGHVFPVYLGFKGGKGVSTALGVTIMLMPIPSVIALVVFVVVVVLSRFVSLGSMLGVITLFLVVLAQYYLLPDDIALVYVYLTLAMTILILFTHRKNIIRLIGRTENRVAFSSQIGNEGHRD
ncbi:MAG: glycerol-3-phosphate 1-O-acyltransferase PlsY [candidate division Zixibacteria bacterium]|nr:glycerol-3-phosphate 1-O-acyltransferase PlsY [candidate division Zixibacteria bacterium]